jgi:quinohemoprotein ethanol dehydrogenase
MKNPGHSWHHAVASCAAILLMSLAAPGARAADAAPPINPATATTNVDWPGIGLSADEQRYVRVNQIDAQNVNRLALVSSFDLSAYAHVVTAPIAVDGVIYFAAGLSVIHAVDAASGTLLWKYDPEITRQPGAKKMRLGWGTRGITYGYGKIYFGTADGRLIALNATTGQLVWSQLTVGVDDARSITGPPRVFDGKVIIGHGGADYGPVRGYVTTYDAATGKQLWRFYTVPGNPADGFEDDAQKLAAKTWSGEWWKLGGGGTVWNAITYDKQLNRIYLGTGNGAPWNQKIRSPQGGDNLFLCSIVALDATTGKYLWHYQINPGETWDYNAAFEMILADLKIHGTTRKVLMQAPKNGFFYVIDRVTGKLISADPLVKVTWASKIDLKTGRPVEVPGSRYENGEVLMWPGSIGGHNWLPMSFSPKTGLVYIPVIELPGFYTDKGIDLKHWKPTPQIQLNTGLASTLEAELSANVGSSRLMAWDPVNRKIVWQNDTPAVINGATFATESNLVFQNQVDGNMLVHDARTGQTLAKIDTGGPSIAPPISFVAHGRQYVAVIAGLTGPIAAANAGFIRMPAREQAKRLLVYALDGKAVMPPLPDDSRQPLPLLASDFAVDQDKAHRGLAIYNATCFLCHGPGAVSAGAAPDLRASPIPLSFDTFRAVVAGGGLKERGMPQFDELSDDDLVALQHYIRLRADKGIATSKGSSP